MVLSGCAQTPQPFDESPVADASSPSSQENVDTPVDDVWFDCANLTRPERWYGHSDGALWCVQEGGGGGASGSIVSPATTLTDTFAGKNGSLGHAVGSAVTAHVYVMSWAGPCLADVTVRITADQAEVAWLQKEEAYVDYLTGPGHWLRLDGTLDAPVAEGAVLALDVEVAGLCPVGLRGRSGDLAPWFQLGADAGPTPRADHGARRLDLHPPYL